MSESKSQAKPDYVKPEGSETEHELVTPAGPLRYKATADWIVLRKDEKPSAELFHVFYRTEDENRERPITFVFNGGPGAASAYLHIGALGPRRVLFNQDGTSTRPPARLANNLESWLEFTDLVFIDPVGTGFSRVVTDEAKASGGDKADKADKADAGGADAKQFYQLKRDLESLGEFVQRFLSRHSRWCSPAFIAGESYGGFRVAKLAKLLQEGYGVGLNGAILISPALEFGLLNSSDYDVLPWIGSFPTMAAAASFHGLSTAFPAGSPIGDVLGASESFALEKLAPLLVQGPRLDEARRAEALDEMAALLGLPREALATKGGRVDIMYFVRELLRSQRLVCGLYDASITASDPFPDRPLQEGPDPTLFSIERVFTSGANSLLRDELKLETERDYHLLNMEVNKAWKNDLSQHVFDPQVGATDDLRYGMALNPHMKVWITHGYYDLVTPYYASNRLADLMNLDTQLRANLRVEHFTGGHMFYAWEASRLGFRDAAREFVSSAL